MPPKSFHFPGFASINHDFPSTSLPMHLLQIDASTTGLSIVIAPSQPPSYRLHFLFCRPSTRDGDLVSFLNFVP